MSAYCVMWTMPPQVDGTHRERKEDWATARQALGCLIRAQTEPGCSRARCERNGRKVSERQLRAWGAARRYGPGTADAIRKTAERELGRGIAKEWFR